MSKYTDEFKLSVVEQYLGGVDGVRAVGAQQGVDEGLLREWVACYQVHGAVGLRKKHGSYSGEFKLSVLKHMWDNSLSYRETSALFNIGNRKRVADWERRYRRGGVRALIPRRKGRPKPMSDPGAKVSPSFNDEKQSREELLAELNHLRMENAYLKKVEALVAAKRARKRRK